MIGQQCRAGHEAGRPVAGRVGVRRAVVVSPPAADASAGGELANLVIDQSTQDRAMRLVGRPMDVHRHQGVEGVDAAPVAEQRSKRLTPEQRGLFDEPRLPTGQGGQGVGIVSGGFDQRHHAQGGRGHLERFGISIAGHAHVAEDARRAPMAVGSLCGDEVFNAAANRLADIGFGGRRGGGRHGIGDELHARLIDGLAAYDEGEHGHHHHQHDACGGPSCGGYKCHRRLHGP